MLCFDFHAKSLGTFQAVKLLHMSFEVDHSFFHSTLVKDYFKTYKIEH